MSHIWSSFRRLSMVRLCSTSTSTRILPSLPKNDVERTAQVRRLIEAKEKTGLTFSEIAKRCGITNVYCTQLFYGRSCTDNETALKLKKIVPALTEEDIDSLKRAPLRTFDEKQQQDPLCYRLQEAVFQYGEAIKALVNEECGDGILSAIDMYMQVEKVTGPQGEPRVILTINGKFLPQIIQNTSALEKMKK